MIGGKTGYLYYPATSLLSVSAGFHCFYYSSTRGQGQERILTNERKKFIRSDAQEYRLRLTYPDTQVHTVVPHGSCMLSTMTPQLSLCDLSLI